MSFFGWDPVRITSHSRSHLAHGALVFGLGLAFHVLGVGWGRFFASLGLLYFVGREVRAHRQYRLKAHAGALSVQELRKGLWDSKLDVAWPGLGWAIVWTLPAAGTVWPWWIGAAAILLLVGRVTDPGGLFGGVE